MTYPPNGQFPNQYPTDPPEPPRSQWSSPAVVVAVIAGVVVLAGGVIAAVYFAKGDNSDTAGPTSSSTTQSGPVSQSTVTVTGSPAAPTAYTPPPTTTTQAHDTPTVAGTDRQGFTSISAARCNADDDAVFVGYTSRSHVVICQVGADTSRLYYKGYAEGDSIEVGYPSRSGDTFDAQNGSTVYRVSPSALTILVPGDSPTVEPMISSWVN
ncbi:hypothetical protein [Gordonia sp. MMO-8]|uniref:hypothetical protein n=1 Tax=Gordonia sp. MMO-8 TaxID=3127886 RepID=UPI003015FDF9